MFVKWNNSVCQVAMTFAHPRYTNTHTHTSTRPPIHANCLSSFPREYLSLKNHYGTQLEQYISWRIITYPSCFLSVFFFFIDVFKLNPKLYCYATDNEWVIRLKRFLHCEKYIIYLIWHAYDTLISYLYPINSIILSKVSTRTYLEAAGILSKSYVLFKYLKILNIYNEILMNIFTDKKKIIHNMHRYLYCVYR